MSDNQPLTEQTESVPQHEAAEQTAMPEETEALTETSEASDAPEDSAEAVQEDDRVFGLPRPCFHGAAFGVAAGYVLAGLIGLAFDWMPDATICAVICAVIGYLIAKRRYDNQRASSSGDTK